MAIVCKTPSECPSVGAGDKLRCFIAHCPAILRGYRRTVPVGWGNKTPVQPERHHTEMPWHGTEPVWRSQTNILAES